MSDLILIPFKGMQIEAKSEKKGDATFYQVTNSWKMVSNKATKNPKSFLLIDDTRKFMVKAYLSSASGVATSRLSKLDGFDITTDDGLNAYLTHTHNKRLPKEIEKFFVDTPNNTKLGTFFEKALYLKYAMYLDKDFELAALNFLNKMIEFSQMPASEQVDILTDTIIAIDDAKIKARELTFDEATQVALDKLPSEKMRALGKLGTKELTDILKKFDLDNKYALCHDTIYRNLFGHRASEIKALVEETGSIAARNFLTRYAYRPIIALEQRLTNKLELMHKKGVRTFTYNELNDMVATFAKELSADISDPDMEIDFLIKANKEKLIEVSLDTDFNTTKKESVIVSNQLSFFDKF
jgi:hypothetical protein